MKYNLLVYIGSCMAIFFQAYLLWRVQPLEKLKNLYNLWLEGRNSHIYWIIHICIGHETYEWPVWGNIEIFTFLAVDNVVSSFSFNFFMPWDEHLVEAAHIRSGKTPTRTPPTTKRRDAKVGESEYIQILYLCNLTSKVLV